MNELISPGLTPAARNIDELVARARAAQKIANDYDQKRVDQLVAAAGWAIIEPARNRELAELAVADTGIGNVDDKIRKNHRKTLGLLRDLQGARSVGVIAEDAARGLVEIARPVGVVAAITPSTNPAATPANKIINALKGRNAIIVAPSPKGWSTCARLIEFIYQQFDRIGAPHDLVQLLPSPVTKESTLRIDAAGRSGRRHGFAGERTSRVRERHAGVRCRRGQRRRHHRRDRGPRGSGRDDRALEDVRQRDQLLVGEQRRVDRCDLRRLHSMLQSHGALLLPADGKARLQQTMWRDGKLSARVIGQSAAAIAERAGLAAVVTQKPKVLMIEERASAPSIRFPARS